MPSEKSARVSEKRRLRKRPLRTAARTYVKKAQEAITLRNREAAEEQVKEAIKILDKTAQKGVIHKNNAARRKSRLMAKLNRIEVSAPPPTPPQANQKNHLFITSIQRSCSA